MFVLARAEFGHPLPHLGEPLRLANDLPEPAALLRGLYKLLSSLLPLRRWRCLVIRSFEFSSAKIAAEFIARCQPLTSCAIA